MRCVSVTKNVDSKYLKIQEGAYMRCVSVTKNVDSK